jgi:hypothetical protein
MWSLAAAINFLCVSVCANKISICVWTRTTTKPVSLILSLHTHSFYTNFCPIKVNLVVWSTIPPANTGSWELQLCHPFSSEPSWFSIVIWAFGIHLSHCGNRQLCRACQKELQDCTLSTASRWLLSNVWVPRPVSPDPLPAISTISTKKQKETIGCFVKVHIECQESVPWCSLAYPWVPFFFFFTLPGSNPEPCTC